MDLHLSGKLAIVTGGSKGIGAAIGRRLAEEGCDLILVARSDHQLRATADEIASISGRHVTAFPADLASSADVRRLADACRDADILVNNAGAIPGGRIEEIDEAAWRSAWDLKVFGYINLIRAVLPAMRRRGGGAIVNVIGAGALIRDPTYICGVAGNAALIALTMSLGSDSHKDGIRIVGVNPGPVATERLLSLQPLVESNSRPFGRPASTDEIAAAVAFLASPLSGYTSGTVFTIDGGISARSA